MPRKTTSVAGWGLAFVLLVGPTPQAQAEVILYQTGFESPPFTVGNLQGQAGWRSQFANNTSGVVTTANPSSGNQAMQILGSRLAPRFAGDTLLWGSYSIAPLNYDAVARGTPYVLTEADIRLDGPLTGPPIAGDLISANLAVFAGPDALRAGELYLSSDGHLYGAGFGLSYLFGVPVALGEYHRLGVGVDFLSRRVDYFLDGNLLGSTTLNPAITSNLFFRPNFRVLAVNPPVAFNPADYNGYYDNIRIVAFPEPGTLALVGVALAGVVVARPWRRRPA